MDDESKLVIKNLTAQITELTNLVRDIVKDHEHRLMTIERQGFEPQNKVGENSALLPAIKG